MPRLAARTINKTPDEVLIRKFKLKGKGLGTAEVISTVDEIVSSPPGLTLAPGTITGLEFEYTVSAGVLATDYTVSATVTTDQGQTLVPCGMLEVRDCATIRLHDRIYDIAQEEVKNRQYTFAAAGLASGETITSIDNVNIVALGLVTEVEALTAPIQSFSGQEVQLQFYGGTTGETYRIEVRVSTSAGQTVEGCGRVRKVSVCGLPDEPQNFAATAGPGGGEISLAWDSVAAAASYDVYRTGLLLTNVATNSHVDTGLTPGLPKIYFVRAIDADGLHSLPSNTDGATPS